MSEEKKYQASKSTSNKRSERKRDILSGLPHSEFLGIASTFSGSVLSLLLGITIYNNTSAASINITVPTSSTILNTLNNGTFSASSTNAEAELWTDNYSGYTFMITGSNTTGALEGTNGNIQTIQSEVTATQFANESSLMNKWGFRPSKLYVGGTTIENENYIKSPTSSEPVIIDVTKSANDVDSKNNYTLAIAAKVDGDTALGSYSQTFTLAAVANNTPYHIAYTDDAQNMPDMTKGETAGTSVTISDKKPYKNGYIFLGWCTEATTNGTCPHTPYQPGDTYNLDSTTDNSVTLHAMWGTGYNSFDAAFANAGKTKVDDTYYAMQDMSADICRTIVVGTEGTLVDTRDNRTYAVSKYADDNCWMHQNLELTFYTEDGTGYSGNNSTKASTFASGKGTLDSSNTDITSGNSYNVNTFYATQNAAPGSSTGTWEDNGSDGGHSFSWVAYDANQAYAIPTGSQNQYGQNGYTTSASGKPHERGGNLYNWTMATLGSGNDISTDGTNAPDSICPRGWQLPDNAGNKSFYNLLNIYYNGMPSEGNPQADSTIANPSALTQQQNLMRSDPLNFVVSGVYYRSNGTIGLRTTEGTFWTGTAVSAASARSPISHFTGFYPQGTNYRGYGLAVRCVAR